MCWACYTASGVTGVDDSDDGPKVKSSGEAERSSDAADGFAWDFGS